MGASAELDNEVGLLGFVYGMVGAEWVPASGLVALLGDYGRSPAAARSMLARQLRNGTLVSRREGRTSSYSLSGPVRVRFEELEAIGLGAGGVDAPAWDGKLHGWLFGAPESARPWRDAVRRIGLMSGLRLLRPGLLVSVLPTDGAVLAGAGPVPSGGTLLPVRLELSAQDARQAVRELWELDETSQRQRACRDALVALGSPPGRAELPDLWRYSAAVQEAYHLLMVSPVIPEELLPPDWPLGELVAAVVHTNEVWTSVVRDYCLERVGLTPGR